MILPALPSYLIAATAGLLAVVAVIGVTGGATIPLGGTEIPLAYLLPPLTGPAVLQLVHGALSGRWRGGVFWLTALPVSLAAWGFALILMLQGSLNPADALILYGAACFLAGLVALSIGRRRG